MTKGKSTPRWRIVKYEEGATIGLAWGVEDAGGMRLGWFFSRRDASDYLAALQRPGREAEIMAEVRRIRDGMYLSSSASVRPYLEALSALISPPGLSEGGE